MSVFEVRGGNDRRSMIKRYERKSKQEAIRELVDLIHCNWNQIEQLEAQLTSPHGQQAQPAVWAVFDGPWIEDHTADKNRAEQWTEDGREVVALYTAPSAPATVQGVNAQLLHALERCAASMKGDKLYVNTLAYAQRAIATATATAPAKCSVIGGLDVSKDRFEIELPAMQDDLHNAIQRAAAKLPVGWEIRLSVEHHAGGVELYDEDGNEVDFPSNHEHLATTVNDAIDAALDAQQNEGGAA